jgi:hypothetical protein
MKLLSIAIPFVLFLILGGCEKTSDLGAMKEEALGIAGHHKQRFGDLDRRADALDQRGKAVSTTLPDAPIATARFEQAKARLDNEIAAKVADAPKAIHNAAGTGDRNALRRLMYQIDETLSIAYTELNARLDAYESWLANAELLAAAPKTPAPGGTPTPTPAEPPAATPTPDPAPAPPANPG